MPTALVVESDECRNGDYQDLFIDCEYSPPIGEAYSAEGAIEGIIAERPHVVLIGHDPECEIDAPSLAARLRMEDTSLKIVGVGDFTDEEKRAFNGSIPETQPKYHDSFEDLAKILVAIREEFEDRIEF